MTVSFCTLGCKVNQYESEAVEEIFASRGYEIVDSNTSADIIIVNSCTVTAESNRKTRQTVRRFRAQSPDAVIVLTGCMAQAFPKECESIIEADIIVGNSDHKIIPDLCEKFLSERQRIIEVKEHRLHEKFASLSCCRFSEHTRSYIKIEDGCDRFCSYCIIPFARGRVRSKSIVDIEKEAKALAENGYREAVLVGINLSAYGHDNGTSLCDAVEAVAKANGIERIRLGSLECDQLSDAELIRLRDCKKFCPQFHLSLQSGCDKTLREMNRKYDTAFYRDLVKRIRNTFDNPSITTDIMVGFAGETDEDFESSLAFAKEIGFARSHIFIYSVREGTAAAKRKDFVEPTAAKERSRRMTEATKDTENEFLRSQVGKTAGVLFETVNGEYFVGYTEDYTRVAVKTDKNLENEILPVKIISVEGDRVIGELVNKL